MTTQASGSAKSAHTTRLDGGLKAWLQVLSSFCVFFNTWDLVNSFGVFQTFYQSDLLRSRTPSNISWIGSVQTFLILVGAALVGPLFDRGYLRTLIRVGSLLVVFGTVMVSLCTEYWQLFLAQGVTVGLGLGCLFLPSVAVIAHYFVKRKSAALGVASAGGSLGGILYPIVFQQLEPRVGFPWAMRIMGFMILAILIVPICFLSVQLPHSAIKRPFYDKRAFTDRPYMTFCVGQFFGLMAVYITLFYIHLYALERTDTHPTVSSYLLSIINAASIAGRLLPNFVADKIGPLNVLIPLTGGAAVLTFGWIGIHSGAGLIIFCVLYGFFQGPFVSLPPTIVATLSPDLRSIGVRLGMMLAISGFGSLIGEPVAGAILLRPNGWMWLQIWCAVLFVVSGVFSVISKHLVDGMKKKDQILVSSEGSREPTVVVEQDMKR
ncbi:MFS general substrate transporter [Glarea lozoyensis ATCC 20868]|uniref:MFS general substrate transporter n=1 Tax=Glarea lozoyensis (strain ATCC 20868 / MF5171) TaxID=1116229 RepID=S3D1Z5_GLAL2|nr:MFS general substrate transporter [Glarea lozoyensis ATCC 20868]EPE31184.1 MFS general substrate transporter [Glarea lozoyensis ATCC 20868]